MESRDSDSPRRPSALPSTDRLEAFTDAVLAIVITLMAVEIAPPAAEAVSRLGLTGALAEKWPDFLAYAISFLLVGQVWMSHYAMWQFIDRADRFLKLAQLVHLFWISLVPLASQLLAEYLTGTPAQQETGAALYAGVALLAALFFLAAWLLALYRGFASPNLGRRTVRRITLRYASAPLLYGLALAVAFIDPHVSVGLYVLLIVYFILPGLGDPHRITAD